VVTEDPTYPPHLKRVPALPWEITINFWILISHMLSRVKTGLSMRIDAAQRSECVRSTHEVLFCWQLRHDAHVVFTVVLYSHRHRHHHVNVMVNVKVIGKSPVTCSSDAYMSRLKTSSALQPWKW